MDIRIKLSVLNDQGLPFMGRGPVELLLGIKRLGSIKQAAEEMQMSYVKAWKIIKRMEISLGSKILKTEIGGRDHGGSELTALADSFLDSFTSYESAVADFARREFASVKDRIAAKGRSGESRNPI